jgi:alpha-glucosidase
MTFLTASGPLIADGSAATLPLTGGFSLRINVLEPWLIRVAVAPEEGFTVDRTWMIAPGGDVPWAGRDRLSSDGFAGVDWAVEDGTITAGDLRIQIQRAPLALTFFRHTPEGWRAFLADRPSGAYQWFARRSIFRHFQARALADGHYGLGDKTGPLDHTGRRLRCLQTDALGYDAETADPLYKHAPFLIVDGDDAGATGLLYDTLSEIAFDLGAEHSNYHPHYRHVDAAEKGLVYYVIAGPRLRDVVPRLMALTGRPHLPPRWSMGFAFTTMHHADAPNAQEVITGFAERCRVEEIPISAIHSGSGYTTKADGRRYVFTWNEQKFPDREGFFRRLKELGFNTAANVKPVLLTEHPAYAQAASEGWFVRRADGAPAVEMFWGGNGSSLDFTNEKTIAWWQDGITRQVLGAGFTAPWNDNNECELWDETALVDGFGKPLPAIDVRPLHALLMTRATYEATLAREPEKRPYTISRAGPIGIARYGETW